MREIKFRIFDGVEMNYNVIGFDYNCGGIKKDVVTTFHEKYGTEFFQISDNFPLMQYTGIKDKNGKEIYEGDIVRYFKDELATIEFKRGCFVIESENYIDYFYEILGEIEVIGNIYENEDLLKNKKGDNMQMLKDLIEDYKNNIDNLIHEEIIKLGYKPKIANKVILEDIKEFLITNNIDLQIECVPGEESIKGINTINGEILFEYKSGIKTDLENNCITKYFIKVK